MGKGSFRQVFADVFLKKLFTKTSLILHCLQNTIIMLFPALEGSPNEVSDRQSSAFQIKQNQLFFNPCPSRSNTY